MKLHRYMIMAMSIWMVAMGVAQNADSEVDAENIIRQLERNQVHAFMFARSSMTTKDFLGERTSTFEIQSKGREKALIEFTSVAERGQKILRANNKLYLYYPDAEDVIVFNQSMFQDSFMGSDISYQDIAGDKSMIDLYNVTFETEEVKNDIDCYVLYLSGKNARKLTYPYQRIWVSKDNITIQSAEMYTRSKKLRKTMNVNAVKKIGTMYVYTDVEYRDATKDNSITRIMLENINFDAIPSRVFSVESLRF